MVVVVLTCGGRLKGKANANCKDGEGYTPLHFAALNGHFEACKLLLQRGANVNARDIRGTCASMNTLSDGSFNYFRMI